ncbi:MAG TPA: site-2 protease family protein [Actinomycetota bacterium]|jgi:Zn-dependent protease|nr:site-2 protease family protein [Actinomycetota bacterium]
MGGRLRIVTLRGIPVYVSSSWILIAALYTYISYINFSRGRLALADNAALGYGVLATVLFFGSIFVHELAHAVAARSYGLAVYGITLEFWGGATETQAERKGPAAEFVVSAAGPGSTLVLAALFWAMANAVSSPTLAYLFESLARINALLGVVNALPGFPLDGGRMLLAAVWAVTKDRGRATHAAGIVGVTVGVLFAAAGVWSFSQDDGFGIWFLVLAWLLIRSSRSLAVQTQVREELKSGRVSEAMGPPPTAIPATMALSQALDLHLRERHDLAFPVLERGRVIGVVSFASARKVGARDPLRPVREGMTLLTEVPVLSPDDGLDVAFERLRGRPGLVLRDGELVGSISSADIGRWYERRGSNAPSSTSTDGRVPPRPDV